MNIYMEVKVSMQINKTLIDADAIVSLRNSEDNGNNWAREISRFLDENQYRVYLTGFVYGEVLTVLSMQVGLENAIGIESFICDYGIIMIDVDEVLRKEGLKWFSKQTSKNSRFTDCVNMAVMEKYGIKYVFSRDAHYKKNGFVRLGIDEGVS